MVGKSFTYEVSYEKRKNKYDIARLFLIKTGEIIIKINFIFYCGTFVFSSTVIFNIGRYVTLFLQVWVPVLAFPLQAGIRSAPTRSLKSTFVNVSLSLSRLRWMRIIIFIQTVTVVSGGLKTVILRRLGRPQDAKCDQQTGVWSRVVQQAHSSFEFSSFSLHGP